MEIAAFVNPSIKSIVSFFQKDLVSQKDMGGIRALALTGNPFFDLAAGFGLIFIVFTFSITINSSRRKFFFIKKFIFFLSFFLLEAFLLEERLLSA
ncbi:hypothetical protein [Sphingobacterium sp. B29]|uniref:hypothetical protein n=1 Tax=Sphingobacterium sp. B29 TaxID=1933220 RepID=UPI0012F97EA2|nr:hypothetical protein [Sphingobacterium sp. B29]